MGERERISMSQEQYLRCLHRRQTRILAFRLLLSVAFLALWESAVRLHWIDGFIFSSPSRVVRTFVSMWRDGSIFRHTGVTLCETLLSFAIVVVLGIGAALLLWYSAGLLARRLTGKYIEPESKHLTKRVEEIHEGKYDALIEQIMQKPIAEMEELYNTREIEK